MCSLSIESFAEPLLTLLECIALKHKIALPRRVSIVCADYFFIWFKNH